MIGAITGDIVGSVYEWYRIKTVEFPLFSDQSIFTDDTVLTIAVAKAIVHNSSYVSTIRDFAMRYPDKSYGGYFREWIHDHQMGPYNSWGNGSAMRVSPVGFAAQSEEWVLKEAKRSAEITHNHPEGIKGAQATAMAIFLAKRGNSKKDIKTKIEKEFGYNLSRPIEKIRPDYSFDESCQGTVPEAIISFLEASDFESTIRNAISLGGDADTLACIAGGIAEAYYRAIPQFIIAEVEKRLPSEFLNIINEFNELYPR
jgi:ADP-ribosylglycohydrolase